MSWAEIKKSVNSDLNTPLNGLITNTSNNILNGINTAQAAIQADGGVKIVKSVQKGILGVGINTGNGQPTVPPQIAEANTTISQINNMKSIVILHYTSLDYVSNNKSEYYSGTAVMLNSLTNTQLSVKAMVSPTSNYSGIKSTANVSWQVIEFY